MPTKRPVVLSVACRSTRLGYVLLIDGTVKDWRLSRRACLSTKAAAIALNKWIDKFDPEIVVVENHQTTVRKARKTRAILKAVYRAARKTPSLVTTVERAQYYPNKFVEAQALAEQFSELAAWVPKRPKLWQREPRNLVYFEALALALQSGFVAEE